MMTSSNVSDGMQFLGKNTKNKVLKMSLSITEHNSVSIKLLFYIN